jgi:cholesterol oxidase
VSVCLLEKGREMHPGEYPSTVADAVPHVQASGLDGQKGDRQALYSFHVGNDMNVFSGCGLGGTSLVNGNVWLRPEQWVFDDPCWPNQLQADRHELEQGFAYAKEMLEPQKWPRDFPPLA